MRLNHQNTFRCEPKPLASFLIVEGDDLAALQNCFRNGFVLLIAMGFRKPFYRDLVVLQLVLVSDFHPRPIHPTIFQLLEHLNLEAHFEFVWIGHSKNSCALISEGYLAQETPVPNVVLGPTL